MGSTDCEGKTLPRHSGNTGNVYTAVWNTFRVAFTPLWKYAYGGGPGRHPARNGQSKKQRKKSPTDRLFGCLIDYDRFYARRQSKDLNELHPIEP